ncbi:glutathione synthase, ATP-binding domain protein [Ceratobasidium sp. AG-Ba]|nr:glutathione synthase, ATP-binding domain protein [Ceratobasidium sp. AG-Ba]
MSALPVWPPSLDDAQGEELTLLASTWALSHGLVYLPASPDARGSAIHAPFTLIPTPFPRNLFERAQKIQKAYNLLYSRIALDRDFLDSIMGDNGGVADVDPFTHSLWKTWKSTRDLPDQQSLHLGLFRSDYMLHHDPDGQLDIKQVEFNTISSSFGPLSHQVSALHKYLLSSTNYFGVSSHLGKENLPNNETRFGLVEGIATAHRAYNDPNSRVLFVVQPNERNVFDQRWLEYDLMERHGILVIRQTMTELAASASLDRDSNLIIKSPINSNSHKISVVYFRATYTPNDFKTDDDWQTRALLESSRAIKCPSLPLQLAGGKMIQAVLAAPGVLERFMGHTEEEKGWVSELRNSWMEMWPLASSKETSAYISSLDAAKSSDTTNPAPSAGESGLTRARERYSNLVLKPQREGGGNNVYRDSIPPFLKGLESNLEEARAWIAMELIRPPLSGSGNYLVGAGSATALKKEAVSELGVFGWSLFGGSDQSVQESTVGYLVRTKGRESDEGGVAVGYSVIDSVVLV